MYRDASEESIDSHIRENLSVDDLSAESIASYRTSYGIHHDSHAWTELPTDEFLCRIGAAKVDAGGAIHPTSAGLLMFGEEWRIMAEFPHFFLDYRQELDPDERWQMRITSQDDSWSGNVFDFYRRVYNNMKQALQVPFRLDENSLRVDETDAHDALREALANCLTNADYHERRGVVILWKEDELRLSNPGGFRIDIEAAYIGGNSDPRNETMMKMFSLINVGERAGGGIPDMVRKLTKVGYERPILSEEVNPERSTIVLPLRKTKAAEDGRTEKAQLQGHRQVHLTKNQQMALDLAQSQGRVTTAILAQEAGISKQTASRTLKYLSDSELLSWHGTSKRDPSQYYDTPKLVWEEFGSSLGVRVTSKSQEPLTRPDKPVVINSDVKVFEALHGSVLRDWPLYHIHEVIAWYAWHAPVDGVRGREARLAGSKTAVALGAKGRERPRRLARMHTA